MKSGPGCHLEPLGVSFCPSERPAGPHDNLAQEQVASCFQTFPKGSHFLLCPNTTFTHLNKLQKVES